MWSLCVFAGLTHPQLVGKSGASVQIVQQKIGGKQIGVQQIQQLIKQQQAHQHAQIITTPGTSGAGLSSATSGGQTIIATSQLISPANVHGTYYLSLLPVLARLTGSSVIAWILLHLQLAEQSHFLQLPPYLYLHYIRD